MTKAIVLTQDKVAYVDDEDFPRLARYSWCYHNGYAVRGARVGGKNQLFRMHREVIHAPSGVEVDHINGDRLDNRRANLRIANRQQNSFNTRVHEGYTSSYKGVGWSAQKRKWRARIMINRRDIHVGFFNSEQEAARAYNRAAIQLFGEFAKLNTLDQNIDTEA